ncbi:hypothetical protein [Ornithinimicrobium kibberense]|uniref:hypothetical protein n=1 Tax=Ornithinimicrobium kibberense TaxID=282060 RepID=UPI0036122E09
MRCSSHRSATSRNFRSSKSTSISMGIDTTPAWLTVRLRAASIATSLKTTTCLS